MSDPSQRAKWRRLFVVSLTAAALGFMGFLSVQYWSEAWAWLAHANPFLIVASLGSLLASFYGSALLFVASIQGGSLSSGHGGQHKLIASFLLSQIGKYIPGRVWSIALQKALLGTDLPIQSAVLTNLKLAILSLVLAAGAAIAFMVWSSFGLFLGFVAFSAVGIALFILFAFRLSARTGVVLQRLWPLAARLLYEGAQQKPQINILGIVGIILYELGYCVGWLCLMLASASVNLDAGLRLTALLSLSYVIGLISLLPAGLGAREGALLVIGGWYGMETASLASVAIVTRLALLVVEFAAALLGTAILALQKWHGTNS